MNNPKYQNKYRIDTTRLKNYDYSENGYYFVTICTKTKQKYFGEIENEEMKLNEIGEIAKKFWLEIPNYFSFIKLDEFIIMPNHMHGIIVIDNNDDIIVETPKLGVSTKWNNKCVGLIINQYKRICTIKIKEKNIFFAWQPRFYDRIIRDEKELFNIRQYILNNPIKWQYDENYI